MKKILYLIGLLMVGLISYSQNRPFVNRSGPANTVIDAAWGAQYNAFLPRYVDTTAANLQKGADSCGAIIYTYINNQLWVRACSPKRWVVSGQRFGLEDNSFTSNRAVDMNGFNMATTEGNWGLKSSNPTATLTIGDNISGTNTLRLYASDATSSTVEALNTSTLSLQAGSHIFLRPGTTTATGQIVVFPTPTFFVSQHYYAGTGADIGEIGVDFLDPIDSTFKFYIKPTTDPTNYTELHLSGPMNFKNVDQITDSTGYDVAMTKRSDGSVRRIPSNIIGGGGVPTSRTLTINGTAQDLSANRTWTVTTSGTSNRISVTNGSTNPSIDISPFYVGQPTITTIGTIGTGTWNGTAISTAYAGTPTGGSTGQALVKNSGTNYDYSWATVSGGGTIGDTIYILWTGQSNTSGFNLGNVDTSSNSRVQAWNTATNTWATMRRGVFPMGTYTPGVSWGTGGFGAQYDTATGAFFYFAKRLQEMTGKFIRVFNFSWGGQSITNWLPVGSNMSTINTEMASAGNPHISFMGWMQGESDNSMTDTAYKNKLDSVIAQFDAQSWFSKGVPIFVITVAGGVGGNIQMNHIEKAITSGQYDQRYKLIDATLEAVEADNIHFTAQGQYNIGNKIIQLVNNPLAFIGNFRQADSTERERQILYAPNLNKGTILKDTSSNYTYYLKPPFALNGNNSIGMILASTNNQVSRLQSYSVDDATANNPTFRLRSVVAGNINGEVAFMRGASTTSDGYISIYTNTGGSQTEKVRFPNAGGITVQVGRVSIPQVSGNSELEVDRFNIETFGVNNNFWSDNIVFNGTFVRQSAGFGVIGYNAAGNFALQTTGNSTAGSAATMSTKLLILNGGNVGIGTGMGSSSSSITGAPFAVVGSAVGIGTVTPAASSSLDMTSTTTGFLSPRMNTTQQDAISSPATGLLIFNTDSAKHCYYTGSAWVCYGSGSGGGGGTPGGSNTQVQYNASSSFAGDAGFVYDAATDKVTLTGGINLSNLTSGRVTFATTSGLLTDDADMTFDGSKLSVAINSVGFSFVAGTTFGLQSFAVNNNFMSDNIVYNSGFKYVATGLGTLNYFASGNWTVQTAPSGTAGGAATMTTRAIVGNTGNIYLGGSLASVTSGVGAVLTALSTGVVGINNTSPAAPLHIGSAGTSQGYMRMDGVTSGAITIQGQAASGTYNFNLPTTAGTSGQVLTSAGGAGNAMTWTNAGTGTVTDFVFTDANGFDGTVTTGTSTPTLSMTTTVSNGQIMYSSSGAITGSSNLTTNGSYIQALYLQIGSSLGPNPNSWFNGTSAPTIGNEGYNVWIKGTIQENSSGNHPLMAGVNIDAPTISANTATVTDISTVNISGAPSATITGRATSLRVNAGDSYFLGSMSYAIATISTTTTLDVTYHTVKVDASGGAVTVNLPAAAGCTGRVYVIKKIDSSGNAATADGNSSEAIDGSTTKSTSTQYAGFAIQSDGTGWNVIATF